MAGTPGPQGNPRETTINPEHEIDCVRLDTRDFHLHFLHRPKGEGDALAGTAIICTDISLRQQISRLKDSILSCVSHELRTPLTSICATAEILRDMPPDNAEEAEEFLRILTRESQHLARVVDDMMEVSLLEADQEVLDTTRVHVESILQEAVGNVAEAAEDASVDVRVEIEGEEKDDGHDHGHDQSHNQDHDQSRSHGQDLFCLADRRRLGQVLARLLDNAIKFTPAGGSVRLGARFVPAMADDDATEADREGHDTVQFTVDDSGFGVPQQHRESVFEKFEQHRETLTDKPTGPGLGLSICRLVVTRMGGSIWCEESDLGGARLCFVLPVAHLAGD